MTSLPAGASGERVASAHSVNAVLGDVSWVATYGEAVDEEASEVRRIRTHLFHVIDRLEQVDVSGLSESKRRRRARALDGLREYATAGVFPRRDPADGYGPRRPRFIDDRGVHCAVGEMIRRSGRPGLARAIRDRWEYAYVTEIDSPALARWAVRHGFEVTELAQIQPRYAPPPTEENVLHDISRRTDSWTLRCSKDHTPPESVALEVSGDERGDIAAKLTTKPNAFARCMVEMVEGHHYRGTSWDTNPTAFTRKVNLTIERPNKIVEKRLEHQDKIGWRCVPRPGPIPVSAKVSIATSREGLSVEVNTTPQNQEIEDCLENQLRRSFPELRSGGKWGIDLQVDREVVQYFDRDILDRPLIDSALACSAEGKGHTHRIHIKALPETQRFAIQVDGDHADFQKCFQKAYTKHARTHFSVWRRLADGEAVRYSRIDAPTEASFDLSIVEADPKDCRFGGIEVGYGKKPVVRCEQPPPLAD